MSPKPTKICFSDYLRYCPETGNLYWLVDRGRGVKAGDVAGCKDGRYIRVRINGKSYLGHRVCFAMYLGMDYKDVPMLDHINGNGYDNRSINIRMCCQKGNQANERLSRNNTSGFKGVSYFKRDSKWWSHIMVGGRTLHLGYYADKIEAAKAYDKAAIDYFGEFALTNERLGLYARDKETV